MAKSLNEWFTYLEPDEEANIRILAEYCKTDLSRVVYSLPDAIDLAGLWLSMSQDKLKIKGRQSSGSYFNNMQEYYEGYDEEYVNSLEFISKSIKEPLNILIKKILEKI